MRQQAAKIFGVVFILVGALGFVPGLMDGCRLLGLFCVNPAHNIVHILSGGIALAVGFRSDHASKLYFITFGIVYALVAVLGFFSGDQPILGLIANNIHDVWLHTVIAIASLCLGFCVKCDAHA
jgi:Domain of unknown function (DUF4383)